MIIDTSALLSILLFEDDWADFAQAITNNTPRRLSVASYLEAALRLLRCGDANTCRILDQLIAESKMILEPVTVEQARIARQAFAIYGKGMGHPAQLNFGDCFTYALARVTGEPLLHKGNDFNQTDLSIL